MSKTKPRLTLDQPITYLIKVPGVFDKKWLEWNREMLVNIESEGNEPVTTLTITVDQAALHGLLRYLYSMGLPLISAVWIDHS